MRATRPPVRRTLIWSPDDFGQARMAALGWLLSFEQQGKAKADGPLAAIRKAAEKTPADVRALWDWFYLCQMRYDNAAPFRGGPHALAGRPRPIRSRSGRTSMSWGAGSFAQGRELYFSQLRLTGWSRKRTPLRSNSAELDHVMACYQALRARRPDLAGALLLINISDELKRASRLDQEERFYREAIAGSTRLGQIVGAFVLAARRGDAAGLTQLFERYDRAQTGRSQPYYRSDTFNFSSPGLAMSQGMSALADRKDYAGVLGLVDYTLALCPEETGTAIARCRHACPACSLSTARDTRATFRCPTRSGSARGIAPSRCRFPKSTNTLMHTVLEVLSTAYELYKRDDLSSDLVAPFSPADRRGGDAARRNLSGAGTRVVAVVGRRKRRGDRRAHQGGRGGTRRVGATTRPGRAPGATAWLCRCAGRGRRGPADGQRDLAAARGAGAAAGRQRGRRRTGAARGRAALWPAARYRHSGSPGRPDAPARPARAGRGRARPRSPPRGQQVGRPGRA